MDELNGSFAATLKLLLLLLLLGSVGGMGALLRFAPGGLSSLDNLLFKGVRPVLPRRIV